MDWKPIETAPTDGTIILLYCWRGSMFLWKTGKLKNDEPRMMTGATHWMPLPAAPTDQ